MDYGVLFFEKNFIDLDRGTDCILTVTDSVATDTGSSFIDLLRNRRNWDGWSTTGSSDAANTQIVFDLGESYSVTDIFLIQQNFKAYTIQYYNGSSYVDFSTPISVTGNSTADKRHTFNAVSCQYIKLIVTGTMVANADKFMAQFIITKSIGQLTEGFVLNDVIRSQNRIVTKSLSGKSKVKRSTGTFEVTISRNNVITAADLSLIEKLYDYYYGFIVWLCGGSVSQFRTERIGYRLQDVYTMIPTNEYTPEFDQGFYNRGTNIVLKLAETI